MSAAIQHYFNGDEIHVRDRVRYKGVSGTIVFVTDGDTGEFAPGYEDYYGHEPGLMYCDDDGDLTFLREPDENLELIHHAAAAQS
jgi:hypothetical protein